jgi:hypothetical protein
MKKLILIIITLLSCSCISRTLVTHEIDMPRENYTVYEDNGKEWVVCDECVRR